MQSVVVQQSSRWGIERGGKSRGIRSVSAYENEKIPKSFNFRLFTLPLESLRQTVQNISRATSACRSHISSGTLKTHHHQTRSFNDSISPTQPHRALLRTAHYAYLYHLATHTRVQLPLLFLAHPSSLYRFPSLLLSLSLSLRWPGTYHST